MLKRDFTKSKLFIIRFIKIIIVYDHGRASESAGDFRLTRTD